MNLGAFSISLAVKDIKKSKEFYQKLGFEIFAGELENNWVIMKNESIIIGLFQGMFEKNTLTFNPGWNQDAKNLDSFEDIRALQKNLEQKEINTDTKIKSESGPANFTILDPDKNPILFDQHV